MAKKQLFNKAYRNFFSLDKNASIRSSANKYRTPAGNAKITSLLRKENSGKFTNVGMVTYKGLVGKTLINGNSFAAHLQTVRDTLNSHIWMFVQALGSRAHMYFQQAIEKQSLGPNTHRWAPLRSKTKENRAYLGFNPDHKLKVTGRLQKAIKIRPSSAGVHMVNIYLDNKEFDGPYPEFVGTHLRKKQYKGNVEITNFKDGSKRPLYGRKGRNYAAYHLSKNKGTMFRPYIGANVRGLSPNFDHVISKMMDDILFYGVFNKITK